MSSALPLDCYAVESWSDVAFVSAALGRTDVASVDVKSWADSGGASSDMHKLSITTTAGATERHVLKLSKNAAMSKDMALTREAAFLAKARADPAIAAVLPPVSFSEYDADGHRAIVMPFVEGVQAGHFFGKGSPLNWAVDLEEKVAPVAGVPAMSARNVSLAAATLAAQLHGRFWNDKAVLCEKDETLPGIGDDVLRGRSWLRGHDQDSWTVAMDRAKTPWLKMRSEAEVTEKWDPVLVSVVDKGFSAASWEAAQGVWARVPMSLVHGDFHPANIIARPVVTVDGVEAAVTSASSDAEKAAAAVKIVLVDWEMAGVGSGPQELGQFMISHAAPELRREIEDDVIAAYAASLHGALKARFVAEGRLASADDSAAFDALLVENKATLADVRKEYVVGGLAKWLWFLPLLAGWMPGAGIAYFTAQVTAFVKDHQDVIGEEAVIPRF